MNTQSKPSTPSPPPTAPKDPIVGIDLGTTNSLVAYCDESGPRVLTDPDAPPRPDLLPSVVRYDPQTAGVEAVGFPARDHAEEFPHHTIFSVKRLMGRSIDDVRDELHHLPYEIVAGDHHTARVKIGPKILSPQEISAVILAELRRRAEAALNTPVRRAVITVPAYFDDAQRQATRDAGRIAGLEVLRIVNEPTAAALAYNLNTKHHDTTVAVFDLGGGTFDVSILRLQQTDTGLVDQVLATAGDTHLGGDDADRLIAQLLEKELRAQTQLPTPLPPALRQSLRSLAEAAKIALSDADTTTIEIKTNHASPFNRQLTRDEFESLITPWADRTIDCCRRALRAAKLKPQDIERVILVGGSTRVPLVRRRVAEFFGSQPYTALDPEQVVALGAAVQGSILAGLNRHMLLLDVIPLSLGIETYGGAVAKLIMANTTIPARATENFTTYADNQTAVQIHVLQGERELVADCRSLGRFELKGIPPMPAGLPKVEVTFLVDANGILNVTAIEKRSEKAASIQVVPNHGLTRQEVAQMEAQSLQHAAADMTAHRLIDLRNQARLDLRSIERQLARVGSEKGSQLDPDYRRLIDQHVTAVRALLDAAHPDPDVFQKAIHDMDHATLRLAELAIAQTLRQPPDTPDTPEKM